MIGALRKATGWVLAATVLASYPVAGQQSSGPGLCEQPPDVVTARRVIPAGGSSAPTAPLGPATDLYCIDLYSTPAGGSATGVVEMGKVPSPFGVAVSPDGEHIFRLTAWIQGLPEPSEVGPYRAFVAWITTPVLDPIERLGEVRNGRNDLGPVDLNKFLIMVTAEASAEATERQGPLLLRGRSPTNRMEAHDLLADAPSAVQTPPHRAMDQQWAMPPMYAGLTMLPGMHGLVPNVRPTRPAPNSSAPAPQPRSTLDLGPGDSLELLAAPVRRRYRERLLEMFAFNGEQPGPLLRVKQHSKVTVTFTNRTDRPNTIHWHGLRLQNRFDGVPGVTQDAVVPGASFRYELHFPDAGAYWYHPHHREDILQELGLYGNILVDPAGIEYYSAVNREVVLMVDDILVGDDGAVPFGAEHSNYTLMGRFGNTFLVNGETDYRLEVQRGEIVRFFVTNVANTRTFNLSFVNAFDGNASPVPLKAIGSDVGKFAHEVMVDNMVIAPAERYVVEVQFAEPGVYSLMNRVQAINHWAGTFFPEQTVLATVAVSSDPVPEDHGEGFATLRANADVLSEIERYRPHFDRPVDHELVMTLEADGLPVAIEQAMQVERTYFHPVEWAGTMPMMNWVSTARNVQWTLLDPATGATNMDIAWRFRVGDVVKVRVHNSRHAFHAMQHPLHIHGQRFLVLEQNGIPNPNLVWKDTVLLPVGSTTDLLVEMSNPGRWMTHCHIAEHLESGMKFVFEVEGERNIH